MSSQLSGELPTGPTSKRSSAPVGLALTEPARRRCRGGLAGEECPITHGARRTAAQPPAPRVTPSVRQRAAPLPTQSAPAATPRAARTRARCEGRGEGEGGTAAPPDEDLPT